MKIIKAILDLLPSGATYIYAFLSFLIPFIIYTINRKLREWGDPPWKEGDERLHVPKKAP